MDDGDASASHEGEGVVGDDRAASPGAPALSSELASPSAASPSVQHCRSNRYEGYYGDYSSHGRALEDPLSAFADMAASMLG